MLTKRGQQLTAFNFMMDENGKIFDVNYERTMWIMTGNVTYELEDIENGTITDNINNSSNADTLPPGQDPQLP